MLIGTGEPPPAPSASRINDFPTLKEGGEFTISGTVGPGGNPPDAVYVCIDGEEYEASVNAAGIFTVTGTLPEDTPAKETTRTYSGTTEAGGISGSQNGLVTFFEGSISRPSMRENAQPHNPLGHYQKREPFPQSRWSKNGQDHMKDHR